jgi:hypothetical protein
MDYHRSNFIIENRKKLSKLYFIAIGEKEVLNTLLERGEYPPETFLREYTQLDNLIRSLARFIMP